MALKLTLEAREDLKDIWRYISEDNELAADRFIDELYSECVRIFSSGHHGRNRPDIGKGVTSYAYRRYVLYFEKRQSDLFVLRVLHGSRDHSKIFG